MGTLRIFSLDLPVYHAALLAIILVLGLLSLGLLYLITASWDLLAIFLQFLLPPPSTSGNQESDLFFYDFGSFSSLPLPFFLPPFLLSLSFRLHI